jgi:hypothetical protein
VPSLGLASIGVLLLVAGLAYVLAADRVAHLSATRLDILATVPRLVTQRTAHDRGEPAQQ